MSNRRSAGDLDHETIGCHADALGNRELDRPMCQEDRAVRRGERLFGGEVAAGLAVLVGRGECRLADKEVGSARERRKLLGRGGVAGIGEQLVSLPDPEALGLHRVVR